MTDYPKALAALRWALDLQAKVGKADKIARFAGHARVTKRARDLLAALDAQVPVATQFLLTNPLDGSDLWVTCPPHERPRNVSPRAESRHLYAAPPAALAVPAEWPLHDRVEFALRDAGFDYDEASRIAALAAANKENNNG